MIFKNILLFFFVSTFFFEKYLGSFVLISLCFCSKKKVTLKGWRGSLYFSLFFPFLLHLFSLISVLSSCLLSWWVLFLLTKFFPFFSLPCFSFHVSSPSVCLSLCLFTLSLVLPLYIFLKKKKPFIYFLKKKTFLFRTFSCLFFFHLFIPFL